jgi:FolB domain-containing protein
MKGRHHPPSRTISIRGLEVSARVGVPEEERSFPQKLLIDLEFSPSEMSEELFDDIKRTVDYYSVAARIEELVSQRPRRLIETLADEISLTLLKEFPLSWIHVTVRKFILPNAEWVSVSVRREPDSK